MLISTHTKNATTYNAVGFIEGAVEPGIFYFFIYKVPCEKPHVYQLQYSPFVNSTL